MDVRGNVYTCFLDGKQITAGTFTPPPAPDSMYATASRDNASGDVIVKVVNVSGQAQSMELNLQGAATIAKTATIETLAGDPVGVNTLDEPEKVSPKTINIENAAPKFTHDFPAHSVNVMRFKTK